MTIVEGGLLSFTALQRLRSVYNLSQQYKCNKWAVIWTLRTGTKSGNVECHMSKWECIGEAVENVTKFTEEWKLVSNNIVDTEKK